MWLVSKQQILKELEHLWLPLKVNETCKSITFLPEWLEIKEVCEDGVSLVGLWCFGEVMIIGEMVAHLQRGN